MGVELSLGCHLAKVGDDLVILDAARDAYLCLPRCTGAVELHPDGSLHIGDPVLAARLTAARLTLGRDATAATTAPQRPPAIPIYDLPSGSPDPTAWRDVMDLVSAYAAMAWRFRFRSFAAIAGQAGRLARAPTSRTSPELWADVRLFHRWFPWFPLQGECLFRSYMLLLFLNRRGHAAQLVFGVRTWPFSAHCWLQVGEVALDDHCGHLASYTPILAV